MSSGLRHFCILTAVIGLGFGIPALAENPLWNHSDEAFNMASSNTGAVAISGPVAEITSGNALVEPKDTTVVKTPNAIAHLKKKSLLFVRVDKFGDHLFCLLEPVTVLVGKHSTTLQSGEEIIITDQDAKMRGAVSEDDIGRRRMRITQLPEGKTLALTEFSLVHVMEREPVIYKFVHSDDRQSKPLRERLIKMAAVLNVVTSRHGPYTTTH